MIINTLYHPNQVGGAEKSVQFLAEELVREGHSVSVVCLTHDGSHSGVLNGVQIHYLKLRNIYWPFNERKRSYFLKFFFHLFDLKNYAVKCQITALIEAEKPELIHTNNLRGFSTVVWSVAKKFSIPVVHTLRDYYLLCVRASMFKRNVNCESPCFLCAAFSGVKKIGSDHVSAVVGNSEYILKKHLEFGCFPQAKLQQAIFNGYARTQDTPLPGVREAKPGLVVGYLGRFSEEKGVELLLSAFQEFEGSHRLLICGKGDAQTQKKYASLIKKGANIDFLGFAKPETLLSQLDVLVVPSLWHEPLSRTIFEAYAHGVPVIASRRGGSPEIVDEGSTGLLFDPAVQGDLLAALNKFLNLKMQGVDFQSNCLKKSKEFLPQTVVEKYRRLFAEVLRLNKRPLGEPLDTATTK